MSPQHDYVIDNSTGANVRSDINSVLQAIASNNSGSSAPSTTFALQTFANTTESMWKLRNAANNDYVNLRKFDGKLPLPDGNASNPSLFFNDDTNTGIFSSNADTFNIATGGNNVLEINSSGKVGIGESTIDALLVIKGDSDESTTPSIRLKDGSDTRECWISNTAGDMVLANGGNDNTPHCMIKMFDGNQIQFKTANSTRMIIDSSGDTTINGNLIAVSSNLQFKHFDFGTIAAGASETATLTAPVTNKQLFVEITTVGRENTNSGTFVMKSQGLCNFATNTLQSVGHGDFAGDESLGVGDYRTFSGGSHGLSGSSNNLILTVTNSGSGTMQEVITIVRYQFSN